jgi:hypothetical protein
MVVVGCGMWEKENGALNVFIFHSSMQHAQ